MFKMLLNCLLSLTCGFLLLINQSQSSLADASFETIFFQRLGIKKWQTSHTINRRDSNSSIVKASQQQHMLDLYSKLNDSLDKPYNLIRSFQSMSSSCSTSNASTNCSKLETFKPHTKRFDLYQLFNFKEAFRFSFERNEDPQQEKVIKSELELKFNFMKLFQDVAYNEPNNYNELKIELNLNGEHIELFNFNSTLSGLKSKLKRLQIHKIKLSSRACDRYTRKKAISLRLNLSIKFKTTIKFKMFRLNANLKSVSDLLVKLPYVVVYMNDGQQAKSELNSFKVSNEIMQKNERVCAKRPFTINFKELGWDHMIIEPKYLSSFYCSGSCDLPLDDSVAPTNHAILISLAGRLRRFNYLPTVCCKPNKLTSKMFLFVDEYNNIVIKKINDLIVESCSCQ